MRKVAIALLILVLVLPMIGCASTSPKGSDIEGEETEEIKVLAVEELPTYRVLVPESWGKVVSASTSATRPPGQNFLVVYVFTFEDGHMLALRAERLPQVFEFQPQQP